MSDTDLTDLCRQIAAEHADRARGSERRRQRMEPIRSRSSGGSTPTPQALRDLSDDCREAKRGVAAMTVATAPASETVGSYLDRAGVRHEVRVRRVEAQTWEIVDIPDGATPS